MLPSVPVTVTDVAFVALTVRVDELPDVIDVGLALIATDGSGDDAGTTVTVAIAVAVSPDPLAVAV